MGAAGASPGQECPGSAVTFPRGGDRGARFCAGVVRAAISQAKRVAELLRRGVRPCGRRVSGDQQFDYVWIVDCGAALSVWVSGGVVHAIRRSAYAEYRELVCELRDREFDFSVHDDCGLGDGCVGRLVFGLFGPFCVSAWVGVDCASGGPGNALARERSSLVVSSGDKLCCGLLLRSFASLRMTISFD